MIVKASERLRLYVWGVDDSRAQGGDDPALELSATSCGVSSTSSIIYLTSQENHSGAVWWVNGRDKGRSRERSLRTLFKYSPKSSRRCCFTYIFFTSPVQLSPCVSTFCGINYAQEKLPIHPLQWLHLIKIFQTQNRLTLSGPRMTSGLPSLSTNVYLVLCLPSLLLFLKCIHSHLPCLHSPFHSDLASLNPQQHLMYRLPFCLQAL